MKMSVVSDDFRKRYLQEPGREGVFEGKAVVFDGSEDYHRRINDPELEIDENTILVIRGAGPLGWPGSAEVVNMQPPDHLLKRGIRSLPPSVTAVNPARPTAPPSSTLAGECGRRRPRLAAER